jgi:GNAT acetyltransferase-like protein
MENINEGLYKEYKIKRLDFFKLKDVEALHKAVYKHALPKNYFQKKYDTAYTGKTYLGYIVYNKENFPVACYNVLPCCVKHDDKIILCAQAVDAITLPSFRNKGLFAELLKITSELCKAENLEFIFGFPNQHSYPIMVQKLGWEMTEQMESFMIPVNTLPLKSFLEQFTWLNFFYKQYAKFILKKYFLQQRGLSNSIVAEGFGGVYRDEKYLQYKTYNNTQVIKIGSAKVWFKIASDFIIGDIELRDFNFDELINKLKKISKRLGISKIFFQTSVGTKLHTLFAERFESSLSFPVLFQNFETDISFNEIKFTFADIDIF